MRCSLSFLMERKGGIRGEGTSSSSTEKGIWGREGASGASIIMKRGFRRRGGFLEEKRVCCFVGGKGGASAGGGGGFTVSGVSRIIFFLLHGAGGGTFKCFDRVKAKEWRPGGGGSHLIRIHPDTKDGGRHHYRPLGRKEKVKGGGVASYPSTSYEGEKGHWPGGRLGQILFVKEKNEGDVNLPSDRGGENKKEGDHGISGRKRSPSSTLQALGSFSKGKEK